MGRTLRKNRMEGNLEANREARIEARLDANLEARISARNQPSHQNQSQNPFTNSLLNPQNPHAPPSTQKNHPQTFGNHFQLMSDSEKDFNLKLLTNDLSIKEQKIQLLEDSLKESS